MLLKNFLNKNKLNFYLELAKIIEYKQEAYGTNAFICRLSNFPQSQFEKIISKSKNLFNNLLPDYKFYYDESCFFNVINNGWVSPHTDICDAGKFQNTTLVILLQKPEKGGNIIYDNKRIIMNAGDAYILNESTIHGLETVKSKISFRALVLWFKKTL